MRTAHLEIARHGLNRAVDLSLLREDAVAIASPRVPTLGKISRDLHGVAVGVVGLLLGPHAAEEDPLEAEQLSLLLRVEELQVGVVDHVEPSSVLAGLLVANDDLLAQLVEGVLSRQGGGHVCV